MNGETLIPTMSLRFVERAIAVSWDENLAQNVRVLQQLFRTPGGADVWKDVPLYREQSDR